MPLITGTPDSDFLPGTAGDDEIHGLAADDFLRGLGGNDTLFGGTENDQLNGGEGDDLISGDDGIDRASFYDYTHTILTGCTVSLLLTGVAQDTGHGFDTLRSIEHLSGTQFSDVLIGDSGDNWLWGQSVDFDGVTRLANADRLYGGDGNDLLTVGSGDNYLRGGTGNDSVALFDANGAVVVSLELQGAAQDTTQGMMDLKQIENLSGSDFNDTLKGDNHDNILLGAYGDDLLSGNKGNDFLYGDGLMSIDGIGYSGPIRIFADDTDGVTDHDGNFARGNDEMNGGKGDDRLYAAGGADTMTGGAGSDDFIYRFTNDSKPVEEDTIMDLRNVDFIDLSQIDAILGGVDDAFTLVPVLTGAAGEIALRPLGGGSHFTVLEAETNGDGIVDMRIYIAGAHTDFTNFGF